MASLHPLPFVLLCLVLLCLKSTSVAKPVALTLPHSSRFFCPTAFRACGGLPFCSSSTTSSTSCPARRISDDDSYFRQQLREKGGDIEYFLPIDPDVTPLNAVQALGVAFCYTYGALPDALTGGDGYKPMGPPDWEQLPAGKKSRAHLWFKDFGGNAAYYLNAVTMWLSANQESNNKIECLLKSAFKDLDLDISARIYVTHHARYRQSLSQKMPNRMILTADVEYPTKNGGFVKEPWLFMRLDNKDGANAKKIFDRSSQIKANSGKPTASDSCVSVTPRRFVKTLSFFPRMTTDRSWGSYGWTVNRPSGSPEIVFDDGEVYFYAQNQADNNRNVRLTSKESFQRGNGLAFRFLLRVPSCDTSEMKLRLPGGLILRLTSGGRTASWNTYNGGFNRLAESRVLVGEWWRDIHVVYKPNSITLFENGVKKFTLNGATDASIPFSLLFTNYDSRREAMLKVMNVAVHTNLLS